MTTKGKASAVRRWAVAAVLVLGASAVVAWRCFGTGEEPLQGTAGPEVGTAAEERDAEVRIRAFCGDCHALPRPASFPRDAWHDRVRKGYEFYAKSGRTDLTPPAMQEVVTYYRSRAPERIVHPTSAVADRAFGVRFQSEALPLAADQPKPAIADLRWTRLKRGEDAVLLACDMATGEITAHDLKRRAARRLARLDNPCHLEPCDLDGDGVMDLVVADLGSYSAVDHDRGRVVWLRGRDGGEFETVVVAAGLGRVADARSVDVDGDADLDLIVAEFGWYRTGGILLLRNSGSAGGTLRFVQEKLDPRPGTIHVPVHDFNGDGQPDFLALVSQEHECVEAMLGQGGGRFERQTLWRAPDLAFGSSTLDLVDLDGDGDVDVLYANGDAFDNMYLTPWHGVQWLENLGGMRFEYHRLTELPGACRVKAGDFDLDGDMDVVATTWIPAGVKPETLPAGTLASVVLLEQTSAKVFARHTLESGAASHPSLEVADFDLDGDLDFAVGTHRSGVAPPASPVTVWSNRAKEQKP